MDVSRIRIISLDVGGTLVHPYPSVGEVYAEILAHHGIQAAPDDLQRRFRQVFFARPAGPRPQVDDAAEKYMWFELVSRIVGPYCPSGRLPAVFEDLYETFADPARWRLVDDALPVIRKLQAAGYRTAILSNADSRLRRVLSGLGITPLVEDVFISAELGFEKPDLRIFRAVESRLREKPEAFLHVGDSMFHDGEGARAAGWAWLVLDGVWEPESGRIRSLGELPAVLGIGGE
jgi:putative hydrolase of the HAD superfamily